MSKSDSIRLNIIKEAAMLFSKLGYERTSMREIAKRVGVSKPAIYYHFANKQALFEELVNTSFELSKKRMGEIALSDHDPIQKLKDLAIMRFNSTKEYPEMMQFIYDLTAGNIRKNIKLDHRKVFSKHQLWFNEILKSGKDLGLFKKDLDDMTFTMVYMGTINMYMVAYLKNEVSDLSPLLAEQVVDLLLNGIKE